MLGLGRDIFVGGIFRQAQLAKEGGVFGLEGALFAPGFAFCDPWEVFVGVGDGGGDYCGDGGV